MWQNIWFQTLSGHIKWRSLSYSVYYINTHTTAHPNTPTDVSAQRLVYTEDSTSVILLRCKVQDIWSFKGNMLFHIVCTHIKDRYKQQKMASQELLLFAAVSPSCFCRFFALISFMASSMERVSLLLATGTARENTTHIITSNRSNTFLRRSSVDIYAPQPYALLASSMCAASFAADVPIRWLYLSL